MIPSNLRELVRTHVILAPGACGRRVRAPAQGPFCLDPRDPGMAPFFRVLGMKNNENEKCHFKMFKIIWFLAVFVVDFSFSLCFTMILDAFLLKSCSGGPRRLWRAGSALAELWEALGEFWEALYIEKLPINRPSGRYVI